MTRKAPLGGFGRSTLQSWRIHEPCCGRPPLDEALLSFSSLLCFSWAVTILVAFFPLSAVAGVFDDGSDGHATHCLLPFDGEGVSRLGRTTRDLVFLVLFVLFGVFSSVSPSAMLLIETLIFGGYNFGQQDLHFGGLFLFYYFNRDAQQSVGVRGL
jgi:hypothetical protein